jgi:transcriptional antiterminator RfaH
VKNWYLIQTKPRQEEVASQNLINQNFEIHYPKTQIKSKTVALFPRYIFILLDDKNQNWSPIRYTKGVANFVRFGIKFAKVPDEIIMTIKLQEDDTVEKLIDLSKFHQGDAIQIQEGALKGQQAIFSHYDGQMRAIILLKILHQEQQLTLKESEINYA